jgi:hypothetical protein
MLHRTMLHLSESLRLGLEDLLADLWHARRTDDLGRLALLFFSDVRRWAQLAGKESLAERASAMVVGCPHESRAGFIAQVDLLIAELESVHAEVDVHGATVAHLIPAARRPTLQARSTPRTS